VLSIIFGTLAAKIAAITVAAAAATGGLAATSSLPAPAQDAVSSAFSHLGLHFPPAEGAGEEAEPAADEENEQDVSANDASEHGRTVSETARAPYDSGRERGEAVSGVASTRGQEQRSSNVPSNPGPGANPTGNGKPDSVPPSNDGDDHPGGNPTDNGKPDSVPPSNDGDDHPGGNPTDNGRGRP
jgi:hypothetical protein